MLCIIFQNKSHIPGNGNFKIIISTTLLSPQIFINPLRGNMLFDLHPIKKNTTLSDF